MKKLVLLIIAVFIFNIIPSNVFAREIPTWKETWYYTFFKQIPPKAFLNNYNKKGDEIENKYFDDVWDMYYSKEYYDHILEMEKYLEVPSRPTQKPKVKIKSLKSSIKVLLVKALSSRYAFEIKYSTHKNLSKSKSIITNKRYIKIKNLKHNKKYYIKVRYKKKCIVASGTIKLHEYSIKDFKKVYLNGAFTKTYKIKTK